jgi:hypothetical protein
VAFPGPAFMTGRWLERLMDMDGRTRTYGHDFDCLGGADLRCFALLCFALLSCASLPHTPFAFFHIRYTYYLYSITIIPPNASRHESQPPGACFSYMNIVP